MSRITEVNDYTGSIYSWKDALVSIAIAFGLGAAGVAFAAYEFNMQLGGIFANGLKFVIS